MAEKESVKVIEMTEEIEYKKSVSITIHDFTKRIDDEENKKKKIVSSRFKVGETSLTVGVYPQYNEENSKENIGVYLRNEEEENVTATYTFKHASGEEFTLKNQVIRANTGFGTPEFLSHEAYKKWAKKRGDVFKLEVKITLHVNNR